jgi:mono/diheme cytochrome c family protein
MNNRIPLITTCIVASLVVFGLLILTPRGELTGSPERGKTLFVELLCSNCHGTTGQGGNQATGGGPKLAPDPAPLAMYMQQLRKPRLNMPAFAEDRASDQDIADIHAYLGTLRPASTSNDSSPAGQK